MLCIMLRILTLVINVISGAGVRACVNGKGVS
jgi:hypothetical protein